MTRMREAATRWLETKRAGGPEVRTPGRLRAVGRGGGPPDGAHGPERDAEFAIDGDHITLCWDPDGGCNFYPDTTDPVRLARRLFDIVELLHERPKLIRHAARACSQ